MHPHLPLHSNRALQALAIYRQSQPAREYAALNAWATTFYPFQAEWLFDQAQLAIANKARQIGWSHTTSAVGVLWGAFHGQLTTFISKGELESKEILEKARVHALILQALGSKSACFGPKDNAHELTFARPGEPVHGRILALPSSGGRGFTGNVFLDEFAYQEHAKKVWDAASPATLLGFRMRVVSTPDGIGNEFANTWELALLENSGWSHHEIPIETAIAQGYPVDIKDCMTRAKGDPRVFAQMFKCSFLDNEFQYIPSDVLDGCTSDYDLKTIGDGDYYAGLDIGREVDLTVLTVVKLVKGIRYVVHVEAMKRTDWDGMMAMVARAFEKFKLRRLCIDAGGIGAFPAEQIKKKHSERIDVAHRRPRVECVDFTLAVKEDLATGLYGGAAAKTLRLPPANNNHVLAPGHWPLEQTNGVIRRFNEEGTSALLRKELTGIRRIITNAGNVRYDSPRTNEGHGDRAWSLALALYACSTPNAMLEALSGRAA